jgi:hypothetical protein
MRRGAPMAVRVGIGTAAPAHAVPLARTAALARAAALVFAVALALPAAASEPTPAPGDAAAPAGGTGMSPRHMVLETDVLPIDRIYTSMAGPSGRAPVDFSELDWVTAYRTEVIDAQSDERMGDEFFCHSQLQMLNGTRLMVTATGSAEIRFPEGYGMTVSQILRGVGPDQRSMTFLGMVLNNYVPDIDRKAKVRATIEYWKDDDPGRPPLQKLYKTGLTMEVEDLAEYKPPAGEPTNDDVASHCVLVGGANAHWLVPPGPQTTRKRYARFLAIDGTVHYAVAHLHNYGRYVRLTDVTTGERLWQTDVQYEPDRMQIARIPVYSSLEGFPIYKQHVYEIEAFYDNTTDHDVDAMAQIDLYFHPKGDVSLTYPIGPLSQ